MNSKRTNAIAAKRDDEAKKTAVWKKYLRIAVTKNGGEALSDGDAKGLRVTFDKQYRSGDGDDYAPLAPKEDIEHRWHKELLSGAPKNVSMAEQMRRENSVAARTQARQIDAVREFELGLISEEDFQDAFLAFEEAIEEEVDREVNRLIGQDAELGRNLLVDSDELDGSVAAMLGLLEIESSNADPNARRGKKAKLVDDWEADGDRLEAGEA